MSDCCWRPSWFTFTRTSSISSETAPLAGNLNWKPLNEMLWLVTRPDTPDGTFPVPVLTLSDASVEYPPALMRLVIETDRKSTRLNSSHLGISYAVFCLKKKKET